MKTKPFRNTPTGFDDFFVSTMRRSDKKFMINDKRFSDKSMKRRSYALFTKLESRFESKYAIN